MRKLLLPFITLLLLCTFLIYYQMRGDHRTVGTSQQSESILKESQVKWKKKENKVFVTLMDKENKPITSLGAGDRKKINILAVNEDFSFFRHVKMTYNGGGVYEADFSFKKGESYAFFLYMDDDERAYPISTYQTSNWAKGKEDLSLDVLLTKKVGDLKGTLLFGTLYQNETSTLTFSLHDDSGGKNKFNPIAKQKGTLYIVNEEMTEFLLAYSIDGNQAENTVSFHVTFPSDGIYKLWGEFQWNGKNRVFPYVIEVSKKE